MQVEINRVEDEAWEVVLLAESKDQWRESSLQIGSWRDVGEGRRPPALSVMDLPRSLNWARRSATSAARLSTKERACGVASKRTPQLTSLQMLLRCLCEWGVDGRVGQE